MLQGLARAKAQHFAYKRGHSLNTGVRWFQRWASRVGPDAAVKIPDPAVPWLIIERAEKAGDWRQSRLQRRPALHDRFGGPAPVEAGLVFGLLPGQLRCLILTSVDVAVHPAFLVKPDTAHC